jgi:hypothetical protein
VGAEDADTIGYDVRDCPGVVVGVGRSLLVTQQTLAGERISTPTETTLYPASSSLIQSTHIIPACSVYHYWTVPEIGIYVLELGSEDLRNDVRPSEPSVVSKISNHPKILLTSSAQKTYFAQ